MVRNVFRVIHSKMHNFFFKVKLVWFVLDYLRLNLFLRANLALKNDT